MDARIHYRLIEFGDLGEYGVILCTHDLDDITKSVVLITGNQSLR